MQESTPQILAYPLEITTDEDAQAFWSIVNKNAALVLFYSLREPINPLLTTLVKKNMNKVNILGIYSLTLNLASIIIINYFEEGFPSG